MLEINICLPDEETINFDEITITCFTAQMVEDEDYKIRRRDYKI